mmetsp:Transcript_23263/g.22847  ORF Transcript_23263/g.22847 Transcript_23263/m.22847 type:complete len:145 (-) Transcript_23263:126-560(-)
MELILTIVLPTERGVQLDSYKDLIEQSKLSVPEWIEPLIKVSYFMHFFSNETPLPKQIIKEIFNQTKLSGAQLDNIFVLKGIPLEEKYSNEWIKAQIIKTLDRYGGRVLNPAKDIIFGEPGTLVVILDDFDPMMSHEEAEDLLN